MRNKINHKLCDIPKGLRIPRSTDFIHGGLGVIIAKGTIIGENVTIYQFVTIGGSHSKRDRLPITKLGSPTIGDNVVLYAYSCILGNINVGKGSVVGAYSLVLDDVPEDVLVAGIPAKVLKKINYNNRV